MSFAQIIDYRGPGQTGPFLGGWFHEYVAKILEKTYENIKKNKKTRIILQVPPRHGKSTLSTILFPAWVLGKDSTLPIITTSYSGNLAEKFGGECKDIVNGTVYPMYSKLFPRTTIRKDMKAKGNWKTTKGGSYYAVGVGGTITGKGGRLIIIDDPVKDRADAESDKMRKKVWDWYRSTLYSRSEGNSAIIIIMQRWHTDDLVGRVLELSEELKANNQPYDDWEILSFPAIAEDDEKFRKKGEALWDAVYPLPALLDRKSTSGIYNWASQYQQNPVLSETQEFKEQYFRYFEEKDLKGLDLRYTTTIDPAISQKQEADNTVVLTIAKEVGGPNWYRIREDAGKFTPKEIVEIIFKHQDLYSSEIYIETVAFQKFLKYAVQEEQKAREVYFPVREIKSRNSKEYRIKQLVGLYQNGIIFHRRNIDDDYELEALHFPKGRRDDRLDAMAMQLEAVKNTKLNKKIKSTIHKYCGYFRRK
jgi:predicted phage terminase large subunit-like protein